MNARQTKKHLKKQINKLKSDNNLMRRIIADSPKMQELYDLYNKPLNVKHTTIPFREYKVNRVIPRDMEKVDYYMGVSEKRKWQVTCLMILKRTLHILSMLTALLLQSRQVFLLVESEDGE